MVLGGKHRRTRPELNKTETEQQKYIYGELQLLQYLSNNETNASSGDHETATSFFHLLKFAQ